LKSSRGHSPHPSSRSELTKAHLGFRNQKKVIRKLKLDSPATMSNSQVCHQGESFHVYQMMIHGKGVSEYTLVQMQLLPAHYYGPYDILKIALLSTNDMGNLGLSVCHKFSAYA
jgi:hypothetical protein